MPFDVITYRFADAPPDRSFCGIDSIMPFSLRYLTTRCAVRTVLPIVFARLSFAMTAPPSPYSAISDRTARSLAERRVFGPLPLIAFFASLPCRSIDQVCQAQNVLHVGKAALPAHVHVEDAEYLQLRHSYRRVRLLCGSSQPSRCLPTLIVIDHLPNLPAQATCAAARSAAHWSSTGSGPPAPPFGRNRRRRLSGAPSPPSRKALQP